MTADNDSSPSNESGVLSDRILKSLQDLLITQLLLADVPQLEVRKIAGVDVARVSRIAKALNQKKRKNQAVKHQPKKS